MPSSFPVAGLIMQPDADRSRLFPSSEKEIGRLHAIAVLVGFLGGVGFFIFDLHEMGNFSFSVVSRGRFLAPYLLASTAFTGALLIATVWAYHEKLVPALYSIAFGILGSMLLGALVILLFWLGDQLSNWSDWFELWPPTFNE